MLMNSFLNAYSQNQLELDPNGEYEARFIQSSSAVVRNSFISVAGLFLATGFAYRRWIKWRRAWYVRMPFLIFGGLFSLSGGFGIGRMWRDDISAIETAIKHEKRLIEINPHLKLYYDPMH